MSMPLEDRPNPNSDRNELETLIKRYARKERPRYGITIDPGPEGDTALRELLLEIDQTMLPRRIFVQCPPHQGLTLFVSNRRLFAIQKHGQGVAEVPQSPKEAARVFASLLRGAAQESTALVLQEPQALAHFDDVGMSVSTALLADVLGIGDEPSSAEGVPEDFKAIRDAAKASLIAKPCLSFTQTRGAEAEIAQLQSFWCEYVTQSGLEPTRRRIKHHCRDCFVVPVSRDTHLVVATTDEELWCLALVPRQLVQKLTAGWGVPPA